eukprot:1171317-Rhodomonas_salina.1
MGLVSADGDRPAPWTPRRRSRTRSMPAGSTQTRIPAQEEDEKTARRRTTKSWQRTGAWRRRREEGWRLRKGAGKEVTGAGDDLLRSK